MSSPKTSQLLKEPHHERPIEEVLADSRGELNVALKSSESDSASSDVSDDESEDDIPVPKHPDGTIIYTRRVKGGKYIVKNIEHPAQAVAKPKMQRQTKTINPVSMIRAQDKKNTGPRSLVPVSAALTVSDSDDDKPARPEGRMKVYKELQFGNSPAKRIAVGVKQDKVIGKNTTISH